ncbi:MAG: imidazoleglycerol-phosphate dehydratase HisB [Sarcina sp.]
MREYSISRKSKETEIELKLNLDGSGDNDIKTGIGFLDHMLVLFSFHSGIDLELKCNGDLEVDDHHSVEDIGIVLGEALLKAIGDKRGIGRYGACYLPMDEALAQVVLDFSGRGYLVFNVEFKREKVGQLSTEMVEEFFRAVAINAGITLHINVLYGKNDHHKIEAIFKGFARALKDAIKVDKDNMVVKSSKGLL